MTTMLTALWTLIKPHAMLVLCVTGIAGASFSLGYHLGRPTVPMPVQVAHGQTQIRDTAQEHADSVLRRQNDSLGHRLAQSEQASVGVYAALDRIKARLSVTASRADSLALVAADTLPDSSDHPVVLAPPVTAPDTDLDHIHRDLAQCDTLRSSCHTFRDSTAAFVASTHALIQAQQTELRAWQTSQSSTIHRVTMTALTTLVSAGAGYGLCRAGLSLPFFH